jgi:hypothetical protein
MMQARSYDLFARKLERGLRCRDLPDRICARIICALVSVLMLVQVSGCATIKQEAAIAVVQSRASRASPVLAPFFVTVHVLLQVHENPVEAIRAKEDKGRIAACQERIVDEALRLGEGGVRAIVAEGMYGNGSLDKPVPVEASQFAPPNKMRAAEILAARSDLAVYGFELQPLNDLGASVVKQLGSAAAQAAKIAKDGSSNSANKEEITRLVQDESTRLNLWYAGVIPERSFLALQTALAVASSRHENQVQLIIGKQHWNDLVYAVNRHQDVRLRLVPHPCD